LHQRRAEECGGDDHEVALRCAAHGAVDEHPQQLRIEHLDGDAGQQQDRQPADESGVRLQIRAEESAISSHRDRMDIS